MDCQSVILDTEVIDWQNIGGAKLCMRFLSVSFMSKKKRLKNGLGCPSPPKFYNFVIGCPTIE